MTTAKFSARGAQALLGAAFTYAFTGVLVREMTPMWGDKAQVAARYVLVFVCLLIYGRLRRAKATIPRDKWLSAVGFGVTFTLLVLFFTFALQKTTLANVLFTFYAANLVTSFVLGTFVLRERVSRAKLVALVFALAGLALYSSALIGGSLGIVFSVIAGLSGGVGNLFTKQLSGVDRSAVLRVVYGIGAVLSVLLTLVSRDQIIRTASLRGVMITLLFSAVIMLGGYLVLYGYQHFDINIGTVILSMELVFGAALGWLFFREVPAPHELIGGGLIFVGSVLSSLDLKAFRPTARSKKRAV